MAGGFTDGRMVKVVKQALTGGLVQMESSHEEADTSMVLHAVNLSQNFNRIIIQSDDTDVLDFLLY